MAPRAAAGVRLKLCVLTCGSHCAGACAGRGRGCVLGPGARRCGRGPRVGQALAVGEGGEESALPSG